MVAGRCSYCRKHKDEIVFLTTEQWNLMQTHKKYGRRDRFCPECIARMDAKLARRKHNQEVRERQALNSGSDESAFTSLYSVFSRGVVSSAEEQSSQSSAEAGPSGSRNKAKRTSGRPSHPAQPHRSPPHRAAAHRSPHRAAEHPRPAHRSPPHRSPPHRAAAHPTPGQSPPMDNDDSIPSGLQSQASSNESNYPNLNMNDNDIFIRPNPPRPEGISFSSAPAVKNPRIRGRDPGSLTNEGVSQHSQSDHSSVMSEYRRGPGG